MNRWDEFFEKNKKGKIEAPEGYFDQLEDRVIDRWRDQRSEGPVSTRRLYPWIGAAAAVLLLFFIFSPNEGPTMDQILAQMSDEQRVYYYLQTTEISPTDLMMDVSDMPLDTLEQWLLSDNALIEEAVKELY